MKHLILKLVLPLTLLSFIFVTKWSYVLVEDGPDDMLFGFPLPYRCSGWHTSMSTQFFLAELLFDLGVYFLFWLLLIYLFNRFLLKLKPHRITIVAVWLAALLMLCLPVLLAANPDNTLEAWRDFKYKEVDKGVHFMWDSESNPDYYIYFPEERKK